LSAGNAASLVMLRLPPSSPLFPYTTLFRSSLRGAVNAVPLSCSAYSPCATRCGELRPTGSVPATASVANVLPNPDWYSMATPRRAFFATDDTDKHSLRRAGFNPAHSGRGGGRATPAQPPLRAPIHAPDGKTRATLH